MGTPATATPGFTFGVNNPNTASGFSLGSAGTLFSSTNLSSASANTPTLTGTSTFGSNQNVVRPGFSFGQTVPATSQAAAGGGTLFGGLGSSAPVTSTGIGGFNFSTPGANTLGATGTGLFGGFGTTMTSAAASQPLGLGGFGTQTAVAPSFGLGPSLTTHTPSSLGLGTFGMPSLGTGLLGTSLTSTTPSMAPTLGLGGVPTMTVTGLGGTPVAQSLAGGADGAKSDSKTLKEYPVPPEITNLTEDLKKYMKNQKSIREEISRVSSKQLVRVQEETAGLRQQLSVISSGVQRNAASIRQLKQETAQESKNVDIMQRTKDIPLALQYENTAPMEYFHQVILTFEAKMKTYEQQIGVMEQHLSSITRPATLTSQELSATIRKLYETFVYLAAQLQTVHEAIEKQKHHYVAYRRLVHGDSMNVFESQAKTVANQVARTAVTLGPSPFTNVQSSTAAMFASAMEKAQQPGGAPPTVGLSSGNLNTSLSMMTGIGATGLQSSGLQGGSNVLAVKPLGGGTVASVTLGLTSGFSGVGTGGGSISSLTAPAFGVANSEQFQLQRPPVGNKRGKR